MSRRDNTQCPVCEGLNTIGTHAYGPTSRIYLRCLDCLYDEEALAIEEGERQPIMGDDDE